jgi:hypothetical protein
MSDTITQSQQNTRIEATTLSVVQQLTSAGMKVERSGIPDTLDEGRRGHCPGLKLAVSHKNGATCVLEIKDLNDSPGGLRATLTFPVEGSDTSSVTIIREEDASRRAFQQRLTALTSFAITSLNIFGREDSSMSDLQYPS